jgi:hypothetical protein
MSKETYFVWRPAKVWYRCEVVAGSAEEAESMTKHPSFDDAEWDLDFDTMEWIYGTYEVELKEGK